MRLVTTLLLVSALIVSAASAEFLITANPIGQGKWAFLGGYMQDSNVSNTTGWTMSTIGGYAGYGLTDQLDILLQLGSASMGGLPAGVSSSGTGYAANLKYTVISEGADMPVSVAVGGGYKSSSLTTTMPAPLPSNTTNLSALSIAAGVSKVMAPFVPYAGLAYKKNSTDGADAGSQIDLSVGSAIAWSQQGAVLVEYTMQSVTPNGGANYTGSQIAAGVAYHL